MNTAASGARRQTGPRPVAGRVPPHDLDAEAAVLAAVLLDPTALDRVLPILQPLHFYSDANAAIYEAARALAVDAKPVDLVTVAAWLRDRERLAIIGGPSYLAQIADATPAVQHVEQHAELVRAKHRVRAVIARAQLAAAEGYGIGADVEPWIEATRQGFADLLAPVETQAASSPRRSLAARALQLAEMDPPVRLPLGIPTLDRITRGVPVGSRIVLVGPPGAGKTALAAQWAHDMARADANVVMLCADQIPDMTEIRIGEREGLSRDDLDGVTGADARRAAWRELAVRLADLDNLMLLDGGDDTIEAAVKVLRAMPGNGPRVLILDSLQTLLCAGALPGTSKREKIDAALAVIKSIAASGVLVVIISEMARGAYASQDPGARTSALASAKESGAIEYGAELHLALRSVKGEPDLVDVECAKNRFGPMEDFRLRIDYRRASLSEVDAPDAGDTQERARVATMAEVAGDAKALGVLLGACPAGLGELELRAALRANGHKWGVERLEAAKSVLKKGHGGVRLVNEGPHARQKTWRIAPTEEVRHG